ncbi:MAG: PH domain-containing protein [Rhodospirillales bacterium]|nr:PH domain-containing protein [Rhodospirillales bacterium]
MVDQPVAQRAATMLPAELLHGDEVIILLLKPSPWFIVLEPLKTLAILALLTVAAVYGATMVDLGILPRNVALTGISIALLRVFWQFLEWLSRVYVLTDQRVIVVGGVLRVRVFQTLLQNIQHTDLLFSIRERFFSLGTLAFSTAGTGSIEAAWTMIANPLAIHKQVVEAIKRYRR